jgi:hypothetical protein
VWSESVFACGSFTRLEQGVCENPIFFVRVMHPHGKIKNQNKINQKPLSNPNLASVTTVIILAVASDESGLLAVEGDGSGLPVVVGEAGDGSGFPAVTGDGSGLPAVVGDGSAPPPPP